MQNPVYFWMAAAGSAAFLALAPAALAAQPPNGSTGETSGPVAHSAVQKPDTAKSSTEKAGEAATAVGAPGVPAKPGTQSGPQEGSRSSEK